MTTNDVLRRLRYALSLDDAGVVALCAGVGFELSPEQVRSYTAKDAQPEWEECPTEVVDAFLDGLVLERRGPPPAGRTPPPKTELTTNVILRKLRIALILRDDDILRMLAAAGQPLSKSELSAFFRRRDHRHYQECGHQVLRKFLRGLTLELRPEPT